MDHYRCTHFSNGRIVRPAEFPGTPICDTIFTNYPNLPDNRRSASWQAYSTMKHPLAPCLLCSAMAFTALSAEPKTLPEYSVHEWGTFTSVQGSDGEPILWNPFVESDLPDFVYTRKNPFPMTPEQRGAFALNGLLTKGANVWLQRMETPVIYFHTQRDLEVDVSVGFPQGLITEWYPAVTSFGPVFGLEPALANSKSSQLDWRRLRVFAAGRPATNLPQLLKPSHYFTARTREAAPVQVQQPIAASQAGEQEQFLFYRGAGNFPTPLRASMDAHGNVVLRNQGPTGLAHLFVFLNREGRSGFAERPALAAGETVVVSPEQLGLTSSRSSGQVSLTDRLQDALTGSGLTREEAAAMVGTWRTDWLGDRGLRVLYLLPQSWTDATLPLAIKPAPAKMLRVMVGRAEILEPAIEQKLQLALEAQLEKNSSIEANECRALLEARFLEPAITRAAALEIAARNRSLEARWNEPRLTEEIKAMRNAVNAAAATMKRDVAVAVATPESAQPATDLRVFSCAPAQALTTSNR
jgi:hypothetical protein